MITDTITVQDTQTSSASYNGSSQSCKSQPHGNVDLFAIMLHRIILSNVMAQISTEATPMTSTDKQINEILNINFNTIRCNNTIVILVILS